MYNILIVEEDDLIRGFITSTLQKLEYITIYNSASGEEALEIAYEIEIHILIIDIGLSGINGIDIARRLREDNYRSPIIIDSCIHDLRKQKEILDKTKIIAYLEKLFLEYRIIEKVDIASKIAKETEYIELKNDRFTFKIDKINTLYIEKVNKKKNTNIYFFNIERNKVDFKELKRINLEFFEKQLESDINFFKCSSGIIVNLRRIKDIDYKDNLIYFYNTDKFISFSRKYKTHLKRVTKGMFEKRNIMCSALPSHKI